MWRRAVPALAVSLLLYMTLRIGDEVHGVFADLGAPQVVVLTLVVAIAAAPCFCQPPSGGKGLIILANPCDFPQKETSRCSSCIS